MASFGHERNYKKRVSEEETLREPRNASGQTNIRLTEAREHGHIHVGLQIGR